MKIYTFAFLILMAGLLGGCNRRDKDRARRELEQTKLELQKDAHAAGRELDKDAHAAGRELHKDAQKAAHEVKKGVAEIKREVKTDSDRPE